MVTCATVRDLLPEHALGVGGSLEGAAVDRHLSWCAACRKEARDLDRAAATFAFALPPAELEPELEAAVRQRVRALAHPTSRQTGHRGRRRAGVILLAAAIASATFVGAAISDGDGTVEQVPSKVDSSTAALRDLQEVIQ
jgi:predicted anti-sigma-YlaC factor YlaD